MIEVCGTLSVERGLERLGSVVSRRCSVNHLYGATCLHAVVGESLLCILQITLAESLISASRHVADLTCTPLYPVGCSYKKKNRYYPLNVCMYEHTCCILPIPAHQL